MWNSSGANHALPKSIMAAALALVALPLAVSAGPDGRRLTLGDNRAYHVPQQGTAARPLDQLASSPTPVQAEAAPPIRVAPSSAQAATPAFKPASEPDVVAPRVERVRHTPERKAKVAVKTNAETRRVHVSAPSTKVAVRDHKVRVDAPYTRVAVDEGRVRVRAPFVDLDIRF